MTWRRRRWQIGCALGAALVVYAAMWFASGRLIELRRGHRVVYQGDKRHQQSGAGVTVSTTSVSALRSRSARLYCPIIVDYVYSEPDLLRVVVATDDPEFRTAELSQLSLGSITISDTAVGGQRGRSSSGVGFSKFDSGGYVAVFLVTIPEEIRKTQAAELDFEFVLSLERSGQTDVERLKWTLERQIAPIRFTWTA